MEAEGNFRRLKPEEIELAEYLGSKGHPDSEIARNLGVKTNQIAKITTKYWKRMMELKTEKA